MTQNSAFKTKEGEAEYLAEYEAAMKLWPVPYEEIKISTRFGTTNVVTCGPKDAPPLVLLHGSTMTAAMWLPNVEDLSREYRVYAFDVMGQPGKSIPNYEEPIRDLADYMVWLQETLDGLGLDAVSLVGMSYGGWLGLKFAMTSPERVKKIAVLSPGASFQPFSLQFTLRGMLMTFFTTRFTTDSFMGWLGIKDLPGDLVSKHLFDLFYFGMKHFRMPPETQFIIPSVFSDQELQALNAPVLLLIGKDEVIYNPVKAMDRARRLLPNFQGELVPNSKHNMCGTHFQIVDERVLDFLNGN